MERKEAIAAGVGQYFTGKPCKHGHISNRYTQSGACAACVAIAAARDRGANHSGVVIPHAQREAERVAVMRAAIAERQAKMSALNALKPVRVPAHSQDLNDLFEMAVELCLAVYPCLTRAEVMPSHTPVKGTPLYAVRVPHEQEQLLRDVANTLYNLHGVDVSRFADKVAAQVERMAEDESSSPPEGWK